MKFCDWDWRPAVLFRNPLAAFAVLRPGEDWTPVDEIDVAHTAGLMSEADWHAKFEGKFGPLDFSKISAHPADEQVGAK
jgi:hypothetical protein